jgi:hypothetical protein
LVTDLMFPNKYAKWRLLSIDAFMNKYDTDVLVINKVDKLQYGHLTIDLNIDYDILKDNYGLTDYDILIFNPKYNYINIHNNNFDGTIYNGYCKADYLLRKKKFRNLPLNIVSEYDAIFHIFILLYYRFNAYFDCSFSKQFIHLYPGGDFDINKPIRLMPNTKIITTQRNSTEYITSKYPKYEYIEVLGGPFYKKGEIIKQKPKNINPNITVCFTSMGDPIYKGTYIYIDIVTKYINKYPEDKINFCGIGSVPQNENITVYPPMSQKDLDNFYYDNVDIILNLDTGLTFNGFPLGTEAMVQGVVLFTTDVHGLNQKNEFFYGEEMHKIDKNNIDYVLDKIHQLYSDRNLLHEYSIKIQQKTFDLFNYDMIMGRIFKWMDEWISNKSQYLNNSLQTANSLKNKIQTDYIGADHSLILKIMIDYIFRFGFKKYVEIGCWKGRTLLPISVVLEKLEGISYGIDPYTAENIMEYEAPGNIPNELAAHIKTINIEDIYLNTNNLINTNCKNCLLIRKTASDAVKYLPDNIDLLFIDGNHDSKYVKIDIELYAPKVRKNGLIFVNTIHWDSVKSQLHLLNGITELEYRTDTFGIWKKIV